MKNANRIYTTLAVLFAGIFCLNLNTVHAQTQVTENGTATVTIDSIFSMSVSNMSLNFGNCDPGPTTTPTKEFFLFSESNNNNLWELNISAASPLSSEGNTIPNENFNWWGWTTNGSGTWSGGDGNISTNPHTFYSAGSSDWLTASPVQCTLQFNVDIPQGQPVGIYTTSLIVKMKDTVTSQEVEKIIYVTVGVNPNFALSVHPASLDFPSTSPGKSTAAKTLYLACSTNSNAAWTLNMKVISELTSGANIIPNESFKWDGSTTGSGTFYSGTGYISTIPFTFYEAGANEYVTTSPIELLLNFHVEIPENQIAGTYTTTLVLTMTE